MKKEEFGQGVGSTCCLIAIMEKDMLTIANILFIKKKKYGKINKRNCHDCKR